MKSSILASLGLLSLLVGSGAANAASLNGFNIDITAGSTTSISDAITIDFNSASGAPSSGFAQYTPSGTSQLFTGTQDFVSIAPLGDVTPYLSLRAGQSTAISFGGLVDYFGLYWGTVDSYNNIEFKRGITSLAVFSGANIGTGNGYVNFFAGSAEKEFDTIILSSGANTFESDNHAYRSVRPVPVPGMILGIMTAGFVLKRKLKSVEKSSC
jgi:hypothetical protein